jgi:hypothetical protein
MTIEYLPNIDCYPLGLIGKKLKNDFLTTLLPWVMPKEWSIAATSAP